MTLSELIETLQGALVITVLRADNSVMLKFYTGGDNAALSTTFLAKTVDKVTIANNAITVTLAAET